MKFFENIRKIDYQTSLGSFKVSDISSYFTLNLSQTTIASAEVSKSTTLVEFAAGIYSDKDLIWPFLYANNSINPFTLTNHDTSVLLETYKTNELISAQNTADGKDVIIPAGSLILPYIQNLGSTWDLGNTGNFSLTGGFAYVQSFDPFTKIATILSPYGGITFSLNDPVNFILNGDTYYYFFSPSGGLTNSVEYIKKQKDGIKEIKYKDVNTLQVYGMLDDDGPVKAKGTSQPYLLAGVSTSISYEEDALNQQNKINYFLPETSTYLNLNKVEQNYVV